jgi:hypothetical protein
MGMGRESVMAEIGREIRKREESSLAGWIVARPRRKTVVGHFSFHRICFY